MRQPAIFLDKDGTLVDDVPFNVDPRRVSLTGGAAIGLRRLFCAGYALVVISNQPGLAHGLFGEAALMQALRALQRLVVDAGAEFAGVYYCPHHPQGVVPEYTGVCDCRKPAPGLIVRAAQELELDLAQSWFIGDILNDIEAGNRAGCRSILIDNGNETEWQRGPWRDPYYVAGNLATAAELILTSEPAIASPRRVRA